jgi:aryl-alcohol dehydrogenase-like predicted oxidoreductase
MELRPLGRTGVSVSKLCLGAMMFGDWGTKDHDQSIRIIHRALDAGINFIDTADAYSAGESEEIVGKALAGGRRDDIVLATKVWFPMGEDANRRVCCVVSSRGVVEASATHRFQMARASSSNATASRRATGSSTPARSVLAAGSGQRRARR